jgi:hypothetical protein
MAIVTHITADATLTTGEIAKACGADRWPALAAIRRGFLSEPTRCGPFRLWRPDDAPGVKAALTAAGYVAATEPRAGKGNAGTKGA